MNPEQWRTQDKVEKEYDKASAALDAVPTLEASARKRTLAALFSTTRDAVAESERADATFRDARDDRKAADEAVVNLTRAVVAVIVAAGADRLLPKALTEGTVSAPETARFLLTNLANVPEGGLLVTALQATVDAAKAADGGAEAKQLEAERNVYVAHSEFFKELHDTLGYIKVNTDADSVARQRLKQRRSRRRASTDDAEEDQPAESNPADTNVTDLKPAAPKPDEQQADDEKVG